MCVESLLNCTWFLMNNDFPAKHKIGCRDVARDLVLNYN